MSSLEEIIAEACDVLTDELELKSEEVSIIAEHLLKILLAFDEGRERGGEVEISMNIMHHPSKRKVN